MIVTDDRSALDDALDGEFSICVLLGVEDSIPGSVHACMQEPGWGEEPWNRWFLIADPEQLTDEEAEAWFEDADYAFLGRTTNETVSSGLAEEDLFDGDYFDLLAFILKFAEADLQ